MAGHQNVSNVIFLTCQASPMFDFYSVGDSAELTPMIVNGFVPAETDHTSHAVILFARNPTNEQAGRLGGGSIISPRAVLTVAHLLEG